MLGLLGRGAGREARLAWWEVEAAPFEDMPGSEKDRLISSFAAWLASLREEAWVHGVVEKGSIDLDGEVYEYGAPRYYLEAPEGNDPRAAGLKARPTLPPQRPWPLRESRGRALLEGGLWVKCYIVYELPPRAPEALLGAPGLWDELHVQLQPLGSPQPLRARLGRMQRFLEEARGYYEVYL